MDENATKTLDGIAEAFEKARYEQLRGNLWSDLRDGERATRVEVARTALAESGITAAVAVLREEAARAEGLAAALAQRDGELTRRIAEHDQDLARVETDHQAELARLTAEREEERAGLTTEIAGLRDRLTATEARASAAEARGDAADTVIAAVRAALAGGPVDGAFDGASASATASAGGDVGGRPEVDEVAAAAVGRPRAPFLRRRAAAS